MHRGYRCFFKFPRYHLGSVEKRSFENPLKNPKRKTQNSSGFLWILIKLEFVIHQGFNQGLKVFGDISNMVVSPKTQNVKRRFTSSRFTLRVFNGGSFGTERSSGEIWKTGSISLPSLYREKRADVVYDKFRPVLLDTAGARRAASSQRKLNGARKGSALLIP